MKKVFILSTLAAFGLFTVSCGSGVKKTAVAASDTVVRQYAGTIPAADCPGIVYDVTLMNVPGDSLSGDYVLSMTYLEAEDGKDVRFNSAGSWSALTGIPADSTALVYQLVELSAQPGAVGDTTNFLFLGDSIVMLGAGMQRIPSELNYTLMLEEAAANGM